MVNLWHEVNIGKRPYRTVKAVIEIPKDSRTKYEYDAKRGLIQLDRILHTSMRYPANYGFIPQTFADDNDPLDVVVLCQESLFPRTTLEVKPIGMVKLIDRKAQDTKIIAVPTGDPTYSSYNDVSDLPKPVMKELEQFFKVYKELEGKKVKVEKLMGKRFALAEITKSVKKYKSKFSK